MLGRSTQKPPRPIPHLCRQPAGIQHQHQPVALGGGVKVVGNGEQQRRVGCEVDEAILLVAAQSWIQGGVRGCTRASAQGEGHKQRRAATGAAEGCSVLAACIAPADETIARSCTCVSG